MSADRAAVVVPLYQPRLTSAEELSVRHLRHYLGERPTYVLLPEGLDNPLPDYREIRFPPSCFTSIIAYCQMLLSPELYRCFESHEFVLIYQLDALVFSNRLEPFLDAGVDYIGAPWLADPEVPERGFSRVGNGGLSLRRVDACLRVLTSRRRPSWRTGFSGAALPDAEDPGYPRGLGGRRKRLRVVREARRGVAWYASHYTINEDHFWADRAFLFDSDFRLAPVALGLEFAFERAPRYCFEHNHRQLPFGCHAWQRYDAEFWQPHLLAPSEAAAEASEAVS